MELQAIEIENFRCFERIALNLHPRLTVLVGVNGAGKTALLDALRIALWPFVKGFDLGSQTGKSATIQIEDVRLERKEYGNMEARLPCVISAKGIFPNKILQKIYSTDFTDTYLWRQRRERIKPGTNMLGDTTVQLFTRFGRAIQDCIRLEDTEDAGWVPEFAQYIDSPKPRMDLAALRSNLKNAPIELPLIAYFGTGRLWYQGRHTSQAADALLDKSSYSRLSGYLNCLTMTSGFKQFAEWYGWIYRSYREAQIIAQEKDTPIDSHARHFEHAINAIKGAVNELITESTGWRDIEYSAQYGQQLVLSHPDHGVLPLETLSDGLRNTIAMVANLAFRAYKLNPHLGADAPKKIHGIALIDEVDMFLHPSWQQTVITSLQKAFPNIQFVVTTHSPQVLTTVPAECIRLLSTETDPETGKTRLAVHGVSSQTEGIASSDVLAEIMGVDPVPNVPVARDLHRYHALIQQNLHETPEGMQLRATLTAHFGAEHPAMLECDRLIRWEVFKRKLPARGE